MRWGYFTLILNVFGQQALAEVYPLKPMSELGIQSQVKSVAGHETYEYFDSKSKATLIYQYSKDHVLESVEVRNSRGKTLEKTRFLPNRLWKQSGNQLDEFILVEGKRGIHRKTDLTGKNKVQEFPYEEDLNQSCPDPLLVKNTLQSKSTLKDLKLKSSNVIGKAKVHTVGCEGYAGGDSRLLKDMQEAINAGVSCLSSQSPESKWEALKLRAYFENSKTEIHLYCGKNGEKVTTDTGSEELISSDAYAHALRPPEHLPGMKINLDNFNQEKPQARKSTLFHEMLHWLGILHSESFDTAYLSEFCCFAEDLTSEKSKKSCELLSKNPRPGIDSSEYMSSFAEVMLLDYHSSIPQRLLRDSILRNIDKTPVNLKAQFTMALKIQKYGDNIDLYEASIYARALKKIDPKITDSVPQSSKDYFEEAIEVTSDVVALMYKKADYETYAKSVFAAKAKYDSLLKGMSEGKEKELFKEKIKNWNTEFLILSFNISKPLKPDQDYPLTLWNSLVSE